MSNLTPDDVDVKFTAVTNKLTEEDTRLWEGLEYEKVSRIAGDEANKQFAQQVQGENQGTESRLSTEVIHRAEGDLSNITSLNALAQAMSEYRIKTDLEIANEKIARQQLGVELTGRIDDFVSTWDHSVFLIYQAIQTVQTDVDTKYASMDTRISKYEDMLQDITTDSIQITMDNGDINMGAWTILSQAREWDLEILGKFKDYQVSTNTDINQALEDIQNKLPVEQDIIDKAIEQLSNAPIIKELDDKLTSNIESIESVHKDLLQEITDRQNEMIAQAQNTTFEITKLSENLAGQVATETKERIEALEREATIRQNELVQEANDRTAEIDERIKDIEGGIVTDLTAINKRVDDVEGSITALDAQLNKDIADVNQKVADANAKVDQIKAETDTKIVDLTNQANQTILDLKAEEDARIKAINTLNDGLTAEIQHRKDGDQANITALENYKVSNDKALANVRTELTANVTATTANAKKIDALDVRLTANESLAASAVTKAETALSETAALATQMTAVNASIDGLETELGKKADATAVNELKAQVTAVDGRVTTNASDIATLKTNVTSLDGKVTGNTTAISELKTTQTQQGDNITQLTADTTLLKNDMTAVKEDLATKVESTAFNELSTKVTKNANDITAQGQSITRIDNTLEVTNEKLEKKAEASALQTLDSKVTGIDGKVASNTSAITSLQGRVTTNEQNIAKKLDASVIDKYSTTVETNKAIADRITSYDANLVIGGTNLLPNADWANKNTAGIPNKWSVGIGSGVNGTINVAGDKATYEYTSATRVSDLSLKSEIASDTLVPITTSFELVSVEGNPAIRTTVQVYYTDGTSTSSSVTYPKPYVAGKRYAVTNTPDITEGKTPNRISVWFSVLPPEIGASGKVVIRLPQAEQGNKATAWGIGLKDLQDASSASASAIQSIQAQVTDHKGRITSNTSSITSLSGRVTTVEGEVKKKADATAVQSLTTRVETAEGTIASQGTAITRLTNDLANTNGKVDLKADASVVNALDSKVTQQGNTITSQGSAITKLTNDLATTNTEVAKKANVTALNALDTKVTSIDGEVKSQGTQITELKTNLEAIDLELDGKADSSALTALDTKVTNQGKDIASQGSAITTLTGRVTTAENNIAKKADASAVTALTTRVETAEGKITSQGSSITKLTNDLATTNANVDKKADATALTTLDTKVTGIDGKVTSQGTSITKLTNDLSATNAEVSKKADSSALTALDSKVTSVDGKVTSNATAITDLQSRATAIEKDVATKADASALNNYYTKVQADTATAGKIDEFNASLKIGAENLLPNSEFNFRVGTVAAANATLLKREILADKSLKITCEPTFATGYISTFQGESTTFEKMMNSLRANEEITVTVWFKAVDTTNLPTADTTLYFNASMGYLALKGSYADLASGKEVPFSHTRKWATSTAITPHFTVTKASLGGGLILTRWQVERGNKSTDWTPAQADITSQFDATAKAISTTNTEVSRINGVVTAQASSISKLQSDLNTTDTKANTAISNAATAQQTANTAVSQSSSNATNIISLQASAKAAIAASGDLIPNPSFDPTYNQMGFNVIASTTDGVPANCPFPYVAKLSNRDHFPAINAIPCKEGDVFEFSVLVACATGIADFNLYTYRRSSPTSPSNLQTAFGGNTKAANATSWTRAVWRWTVPAHPTHQFFIPFLQVAQSSPWATTWYATDWHCINITAAQSAQNSADANATALQGLDTKVTNIDGKVTANSSSITSLNARMTTAENNISNKADATALTNLTATVTQQGKDITSVSTAQTALANRVTTVEGSLSTKADASALQQLDSRVTTAEGKITSNSNAITTLGNRVTKTEGDISKKADSTALTALETKVTTQGDTVTSQGTQITKLNTSVTTLEKVQEYFVHTNRGGAIPAGALRGGIYNTLDSRLKELKRGLNLVTIGANGVLSALTSYDVYASSAPIADLNTKLKELTAGTYFILVGYDNVGVYLQATNNPELTSVKSILLEAGATPAFLSALFTTSIPVFMGRIGSGPNGGICIISESTTPYVVVPFTVVGAKISGVGGTSMALLQLDATNTALESLTSKVNNSDTGLDAVNTKLTSLTTSVNNKADASAVTSLESRVQVNEGNISTLTNSTTTLTNRVTTAEGKITANTNNISTMNSKITEIDGKVTAQATAITKVETTANSALKSVTVTDTRDTDEPPAWYWANHGQRVVNEFKKATTINVVGLGTYVDLETRVYYRDASGGAIIQVAHASTNSILTYERNSVGSGAAATWTAWRQPLKDLQTEVDTKASTAALTALDTKVTSIDGRVTAQANSITQVESTLSGQKLGGTNLQKGTTKFENFVAANANATLSKVAGDFKTDLIRVTKKSTAAGGAYVTSANRKITVHSGTPIVATFKVRGNIEPRYLYLMGAASDGTNVHVSSTTFSAPVNTTSFVTCTAMWKADAYEYATGVYPYLANSGGASGTWFEFAELMIQEGNTPTAWSDSFLDVPEIDLTEYAKASAVTALDTKVTNIDNKVTAQASLVNQLETKVNNNTASLQVQGEVVDGLKASYVVKTDVNGLVTSYGLYNNNGVGAFGVNADFFYVGKGTTATNGKKPFMVLTSTQTIGGVSYPAGTWIDVALIANATIGTAHIKDAAITNAKIANLDASKINTGYLNAARIQAGSISADKVSIGLGTNLWVNQEFSASLPMLQNTAVGTNTPLAPKGNFVVAQSRDHRAPPETKYPVRQGDVIMTEFIGRRTRGSLSLNAGIVIITATGDVLQYPTANLVTNLGNGWGLYRSYATVHPANALYAVTFLQIEQEAASPSTTWNISNLTQAKATTGELVVNGSITADKLVTNKVSGMFAEFGEFKTVNADGSWTIMNGAGVRGYYANGKPMFRLGS